MRKDAMLDLETLGTTTRSVILSVGGIKFNPFDNSNPYDPLYLKFEVDYQTESLDREIENSTLDWWENQDEKVREEAFSPDDRVSVADGLVQIRRWLQGSGVLWAHGYGFDYTILGTLYRDMNMPLPWAYWQIRDSRTLFGMMPKDPREKNENLHNPLADSDFQAKAVQKAYKFFGTTK